MAGRTARFGFNRFGGEQSGTISDDGQKYTSLDRDRMDHLFAMIERHDHRVASPVVDLEAPELTLLYSGELEAGVEYFYRFSIVDATGAESPASEEISVATPDVLELPGSVDVHVAEGVAGSLPPDTYYYAVTALRGEEETPLGGSGVMTLMAPEAAVRVGLPDYGDAEAFRIWRMGSREPGYTKVGVVSSPDEEFIDDGSVPADPCSCDPGNMPPSYNTGIASYAVEVALPESVDLTGAESWRLYRTTIGGVYGATSLVEEVVDTEDEWDEDAPLTRSYTDDGSSELDAGAPIDDFPDINFKPFTFEHSRDLPDPEDYPQYYPIISRGVLYANIDGDWEAIGGGGGDSAPTGAPVFTSPNGSRWIQSVDDNGDVVMVPTEFPGPPTSPQGVTIV